MVVKELRVAVPNVPELIAWLGQWDSSGLARKTTVLEVSIS